MKESREYNGAKLREMYSRLNEKKTGKKLSDSAANRLLRQTAYHESGHLIAFAFFGRTFDEGLYVSVIPDLAFGRSYGMVETSDYKNICQDEYAASSVKYGWCSDAWQVLTMCFSGYVAECMMLYEFLAVDRLEDIIVNSDYEDVPPGSDVARVKTIIETCAAHPRMSEFQVARFGRILARDMFTEPDVWRTTMRLARRLMTHGEVSDFSVLMKICSPILGLAWELPKWRGLLLSKGSEAVKKFHEVLQNG